MVYQVIDEIEKINISRIILESLPKWFGIEEARENYILDSKNQIMFVSKDDDKYLGFLCLKETGKNTVELAVIGVLQEYHRHGIGKSLFKEAYEYIKKIGYEFIQVKTVAMGYYSEYDSTNLFYESLGFKEFEIFPTLWGKENPCQIYIMAVC